jgi:hypothetical protein
MEGFAIMRNIETHEYLDDNLELRNIRVAPNKVLVRKCERNDNDFLVGEATDEADGLARMYLDKLTKHTPVNWCEVLAVGPFRPWTKTEQKTYKIAKGFNLPLKPGDFVVLPEVSKYGRMWRPVVNEHDLIVETHECILAYITEEDE